MKNIVIFDVRGEYFCACVANIFERGNNTIVLTFEADSYANPKYEIMVGETSTLHDLTVSNGLASGVFNWAAIFGVDNPPAYCQIRYVDGDKVGTWFEWSLSTTVPAGMIEAGFRTLRVDKTGNTSFEIIFVASELIPISTANPEDFDVDENGEISLKNVTDINVTKNTDDQITSVEIVYEDETAENYKCKYDSDGNLISFGDINVNWG